MHVKDSGSHSVIVVRDNLPTPEIIRKELTKRIVRQKSLNNITHICKRKFVKKKKTIMMVSKCRL
jgi:hypothetical protein